MLAGNDDGHLKNLSFFMEADGVKLAPPYDLLATGAYHTRALAEERGTWPVVPLAIELPGATHFADVTRGAMAELVARHARLGEAGRHAVVQRSVIACQRRERQRHASVMPSSAM